MNQIYLSLGESFCSALPGFHAFTGCDYTASFHQKGKIKPCDILRTHENAQKAFASLGTAENLEADQVKELQNFVVLMYGGKASFTVNDLRLDIFQKATKVHSKNPLRIVKGNSAKHIQFIFILMYKNVLMY